MGWHVFDLALAAVLAVVSVSVGVTGIRRRSRRHLLAAAAGLAMAGVLAFLHRAVWLAWL